MPSPLENTVPRCLLCSMHCPIGVEADSMGRVETVYPRDMSSEQGACVLGLTAGRLLVSKDRFYKGSFDGRIVEADEAVGELARRLSGFQPAEVAFLLDVNRPLNGIAAFASMRSQVLSGCKLAMFLPVEDVPFARAGAGACPPISDLVGCDLILAIGDPFSTHPVISSTVRDMKRAARGNRFLCVDTIEGRTARAADEFIEVDPFTASGFVSALAIECGCEQVGRALGGVSATDLCSKLGLDAAAVGRVADGLKSAKAPAILLSNSLGRWAGQAAVVRAAMELGRAVSARLYPLVVSTNSLAASAVARRFELQGLSELLEAVQGGEVKALVVVGVDPASVLPQRLWQEFGAKTELLAWAGSLHSEFESDCNLLVPLALPWEESGKMMGQLGNVVDFTGWLDAPGGVLTVEALASGLCARLGGGEAAGSVDDLEPASGSAGELSEVLDGSVLETVEVGAGQAGVVGAVEPHGYTGGISVAGSSWQRRVSAEERALISPALAAELGIVAEGFLSLGESDLPVPCRVAGGSNTKVAALPAHWQALRERLDWKLAKGMVAAEPAVVEASEAS